MSDITLAVTSCKRHDLLEQTLRSFDAFNTCPIRETVIVEDSDLRAPEWLAGLKSLGAVKWIANGVRKGQVYAIDRAYAEVTTSYIFHCEDDWEFMRSGFIEESHEILEQQQTIWTVSLRGNDCGGHPNIVDGYPFKIQEPYWGKFWGGCNWNPGLRRLSDYGRIGSYGRICGYGRHGIGNEQNLSKLHLDRGYRIAVLPDPAIRHIGQGRSKACELLAKQPKVLIAIPACHKYEYGKHPDVRIDHRDRVSNECVEAIRSTWGKDVAAFASYVDLKFFYGQATRQPGEDEVFLPVADDYDSLPHKIKAIYQWALAHGYDYVFKADDDTFIYIDRLMSSGFENHDYLGFRYPAKGNYVSGGPGRWLSARAMRIVVESTPADWAEDRWAGLTLAANGIPGTRDARYLPGFHGHYVDIESLPKRHGYISFHACTPEMMRELYDSPPTPTFLPVRIALNETPVDETKYAAEYAKAVTSECIETVTAKRFRGLRILIAILSCHARPELPNAQRETWLKDIAAFPVDYRYFLGRLPQQQAQPPQDPRRAPVYQPSEAKLRPAPDQIYLDVADDYDSLPLKTQAMLAWAYHRGYDFVFKCDDDTYCRVDRLLDSGFEKHDYSGFRKMSPYFGKPEIAYAQGGAGYWLIRKAIEFAICEESDKRSELVTRKLRGGPEDINVARILKAANIPLFNDVRYRSNMDWIPEPGNDFITCHKCTPEELKQIHQKFKPSAASPTGLGQEPVVRRMERVDCPQAAEAGRVQ